MDVRLSRNIRHNAHAAPLVSLVRRKLLPILALEVSIFITSEMGG